MISTLRRLTVALFLLSLNPSAIFARSLFDLAPDSGLVFPKAEGSFALSSSYRRSDEFYDSSGDKQGTSARFEDWRFTLEAAYGLTPNTTIWLDFPLVYREESQMRNASDFGMGDVESGIRYRFWKSEGGAIETAFELGGVFPTGDSDLGLPDPATGIPRELPLGKGTGDLITGFFLKQHAGTNLSFEESGSYAFRLGRTVEYLQTTSIPQTASDGSIVVLPVGNLKIDWGDQINARGRVTWRFLPLFIFAADVDYLYRFSTHIDDFTLGVASGAITSDPIPLDLGTAYFLSARPSLSWEPRKNLTLQAAAGIPILGNNYPTLPIVESLVGYSYQLEIRHVF